MEVGTSVEIFLVKYIYIYIRLYHSDEDIKDDNWSKIQKLGVLERFNCLVWILTQDRLLTNYSKSRMGMRHVMYQIM